MCMVENIGGNKEIVLLRIIFKLIDFWKIICRFFSSWIFFNDLLIMLKYSSWGLMKLEVLELI